MGRCRLPSAPAIHAAVPGAVARFLALVVRIHQSPRDCLEVLALPPTPSSHAAAKAAENQSPGSLINLATALAGCVHAWPAASQSPIRSSTGTFRNRSWPTLKSLTSRSAFVSTGQVSGSPVGSMWRPRSSNRTKIFICRSVSSVPGRSAPASCRRNLEFRSPARVPTPRSGFHSIRFDPGLAKRFAPCRRSAARCPGNCSGSGVMNSSSPGFPSGTGSSVTGSRHNHLGINRC